MIERVSVFIINKMKYVAIIGTVGVPANYGGFETLVENIIGENASKDVSYTIFCSGKSYAERSNFYKGALLKYIPSKLTVFKVFSMICCR